MERDTRQRRAIRAALEQAGRPLGAPELLEAARPLAPGIGMATVYRTLKGLVAAGELVAVELPGEAPRYEAAGKQHHDHFRCRSCARVYEVADCPVTLPKLPKGFVLEGHETVLVGLCAACARR